VARRAGDQAPNPRSLSNPRETFVATFVESFVGFDFFDLFQSGNQFPSDKGFD
jgi:hypothetical protein